MEVVCHNHELMQEIAALAAIVLKDIEKQSWHLLFSKNGTACVRDGGDKECADFLRSVFHVPPALKRIILTDPYAALKGRSSTNVRLDHIATRTSGWPLTGRSIFWRSSLTGISSIRPSTHNILRA